MLLLLSAPKTVPAKCEIGIFLGKLFLYVQYMLMASGSDNNVSFVQSWHLNIGLWRLAFCVYPEIAAFSAMDPNSTKQCIHSWYATRYSTMLMYQARTVTQFGAVVRNLWPYAIHVFVFGDLRIIFLCVTVWTQHLTFIRSSILYCSWYAVVCSVSYTTTSSFFRILRRISIRRGLDLFTHVSQMVNWLMTSYHKMRSNSAHHTLPLTRVLHFMFVILTQ